MRRGQCFLTKLLFLVPVGGFAVQKLYLFRSQRFDLLFDFLRDLAYNFLRIWMVPEVKASALLDYAK